MRPYLPIAFLVSLAVFLVALVIGPSSHADVVRPQFDHLTTGFELTGRHRDLPCEECHANGLFKGTPRECSACHGLGTTVRATAKSANHILSSEQCDSCHATVGWIPAVNFDHAETHGSCSSCHNNVQAQGKGPQHLNTNLECSVCHSTISWSGARFNHEGISGGCAQCHNGITANGLPASHIPTGGAPCESCHSSTNFNTFAGAQMNHDAVAGMPCVSCHETGKTFIGVTVTTRPPPPHPATGDCSNCHSSTSTFGGLAELPPNHIPTSQPCSQCHSNQADFSIYTMSHQGITAGCANCHGAGLSFLNMAPPVLKEIPGNHIPTGSATCESCHSTSNFATFSGTPMNHAAVATLACSSCHEAGKSFVGSPPIVTRPPAPHIATGECSNCHFSTTTFKGAANALPANHIPLPAADGSNCALCHTNPNDYSIYMMNHNGIANNCAQCHGAGLSFANIGPPALKEPPTGPPAHIPTGNVACERCHSPTNFTTFSGTIIKHAAVSGQRCDSCHELGMSWYGISRLWVRDGPNHHKGQDCGGSGCHSPRDTSGGRGGAAAVKARARAQTQASAQTSAQGSARASAAAGTSATPAASGRPVLGPRFSQVSPRADVPAGAPPFARALPPADRPAVVGSAGRPAIAGAADSSAIAGPAGRPPTLSRLHLATTNSCESCHYSTTWLPVRRVDHLQVKGPCATCHNGLLAIGMSHRHVAATRNCESCHTTNAWTPARFDHSAAARQPCASCHDSVHAVGVPRNHIPVAKTCDSCHGTLAWSPVKLDHATLTSGCSHCHNNSGAVGKPPNHLTTARECATCHTYPDWNTVTFRHATAQYPGQHRATLTCIQCHKSGSEQVVYAAPAQAGKCGSCHVNDFKADAHPMTQKGQLYTAGELADCTGACHVYSDATRASVTRSLRGPHHRVTDATFRH